LITLEHVDLEKGLKLRTPREDELDEALGLSSPKEDKLALSSEWAYTSGILGIHRYTRISRISLAMYVKCVSIDFFFW
jgi:hypothetical protein